MSKTKTIDRLKKCIDVQSFIMMRIKNSLIKGREKEIADLLGQEDKFAEMFFDKSFKFEELLGTILYNGISTYYNDWKLHCQRIFSVYVKDISNKKKVKFNKVTEMDLDIVGCFYDDLVVLNDKLKSQCETALFRLHALGDEKF
ncbi:hypothetical protein F1B92_02490 [Campylobacter sp. FMV-PI01]|uniref:Uncharacterized protein n=1 Tax=Campylobacter portucalensis TaxID=2608384 RepID=A0A6L5WJZ1_9BACT|nr:hypothetical protein [Campylobacter portucalensis]MSN96071.1 hypothetical protein [Campylobacter portucalensis]